MDENNRNFILAIVLSIGVLFALAVFLRAEASAAAAGATDGRATAQQQPQKPEEPGPPQPRAEGETPPRPALQLRPVAPKPLPITREEALASSQRVAIDTPGIKGSINLKGARIDDVVLKKYRETVDPSSPNVVLLSPAGSPHPYYVEHGWVGRDRQGHDRAWPRHGVEGSSRSARSPSRPRSRSAMTTARGSCSPAPSRSTTISCSR